MTTIVNPKQLYTFEQMELDIDTLKAVYPDMVTSHIIGRSVEGRAIHAVKIGKGKKEIFLNGAHHAREWLTTALLMKMLETYCEHFSARQPFEGYNVQRILTDTSIWLVPMVNPDGVTLVQKGPNAVVHTEEVLKMNNGNMDFSSWKANIRGIDLNRQYPADWDNIQDDVGSPSPQCYKGPAPLSEPETKAVYQFTNEHDFIIAAAYHSSGEELYWKYKASGKLLVYAKFLAEKLREKTGYKLVDPGDNPSGGGYTDWFLDHFQRPAFTPEISPYVGPRPVPLENFDRIWEENCTVGLLLAQEATNC
ncbi:M14 family metallopeptidase [Sediminibacillus massiliensis]|uniref:M14 family metallopeptidase n=1 Tax=Sediminibacillus massiliensis TaxID=1926277 RepID=UPI0009888C5B|nr:M14 family metallocarboxypeptidase [Sediminibacillus massiliensis]